MILEFLINKNSVKILKNLNKIEIIIKDKYKAILKIFFYKTLKKKLKIKKLQKIILTSNLDFL
jgi:hypothetical protein